MAGLLQIAEKRNPNIFPCRSRRILKSDLNVKKRYTILFCVAINELKLHNNTPSMELYEKQLFKYVAF